MPSLVLFISSCNVCQPFLASHPHKQWYIEASSVSLSKNCWGLHLALCDNHVLSHVCMHHFVTFCKHEGKSFFMRNIGSFLHLSHWCLGLPLHICMLFGYSLQHCTVNEKIFTSGFLQCPNQLCLTGYAFHLSWSTVENFSKFWTKKKLV